MYVSAIHMDGRNLVHKCIKGPTPRFEHLAKIRLNFSNSESSPSLTILNHPCSFMIHY